MKYRPFTAYPPLLPAFGCQCAAIWMARALAEVPFHWGLASLLGVLALVGLLLRPRLRIWVSLFCAGLLGFFLMTSRTWPALSPQDRIETHATGAFFTITGTVDAYPNQYPDKTRYVLNQIALATGPEAPLKMVSGRMNLSIYSDKTPPLPYQYGERIRFGATLRPIRNFSNPGGFDYQEYLGFKGIFAQAHVDAAKVVSVKGGGPGLISGMVQGIGKIRQQSHDVILGRAARQRGDPGLTGPGMNQAGAVLSAMVLGKREGLSQELKETFARTGLSHMLAISGLHMSILSFFCFHFFYLCLKPAEDLTALGRSRKISLGLTLIPLAFYGALAGFSPSTQRALIMAAVFILALASEQEADLLNTLCLAGILILALDCTALFSISFQLSFAAVGAIVLGMSYLGTRSWMPRTPGVRILATALFVAVFAGAGTLPLVARYFNLFSHVQILTNVVMVPLMGLVCLPLGICAVLCQFLVPGVSLGLLDLALEVMALNLQAMEWLADLPLAWSRVVTPAWPEIWVYYLGLAGILALVHGKKRVFLLVFGPCLAFGTVLTGIAVKERFFPGRLKVVVMDVGQGSASLVHTREGFVVLLDCGGFASLGGFNVGRYVVGPFLWRNRIKTLDAVVLSHPQSDHMNGLSFILENFNVRRLIRNQDLPETQGFLDLVTAAEKKKVPVWIPGIQKNKLILGSAVLDFWSPDGQSGLSLNENSLVCRLAFQNFSMLFPGDIGSQRERRFEIRGASSLASQVTLAPHHGSRFSATHFFLDQVCPESIIICCGYMNRYGFPHPESLERFRARGIRVFRTDLHGAVTVLSEGQGYHIQTSKGP